MPDQMTLEQFGAKIKSKYPEYASYSDTDIANKVIAKYPQYKSQIGPASVEGTANAPETPGWRDRFISMFRPMSEGERKQATDTLGTFAGSAAVGAQNAVRGFGAGAAGLILHPISSLYGSAQLAADALNQMFPDSGLNPQQKAAKDASLQRLKDQWETIKDNPDWSIGNLAGGIETGKAFGEAVGPVTKGLRDTVAKAREGIVLPRSHLSGPVHALSREKC